MSKILVTGGAGFIGSHYVDLMVERGHEVHVVDKMTYAASGKNTNSGMGTLSVMDIGNPLVANLLTLHKIEEVVNFAAETHVDRSIKDPEAFLKTDILGLFNLVRSCRQAGVKRFLHVSTDEVYGSVWEGEGASEDRALNPTSPYSASKASADLLLLAYWKTYNFPVTIVRPCNQYGPRQYPEKLIPMAITRLLQGKKVLVHGQGIEQREWMYVKDCCKLIDVVRTKGTLKIYNIGSAFIRTNRYVISELIQMMRDDPDSTRYWEFIANRPGNDGRYAVNCDRLGSLLGGRVPEATKEMFHAGLETTVQWYRDNPDWWEGSIDMEANIYKDNKEYFR